VIEVLLEFVLKSSAGRNCLSGLPVCTLDVAETEHPSLLIDWLLLVLSYTTSREGHANPEINWLLFVPL
jgi:hypothetical protein